MLRYKNILGLNKIQSWSSQNNLSKSNPTRDEPLPLRLLCFCQRQFWNTPLFLPKSPSTLPSSKHRCNPGTEDTHVHICHQLCYEGTGTAQYTSQKRPVPTVRLHQIHEATQLPPLSLLDAASVLKSHASLYARGNRACIFAFVSQGRRKPQREGDADWEPTTALPGQPGPASPTGRPRPTASTARPSPSHPAACSQLYGAPPRSPIPSAGFPVVKARKQELTSTARPGGSFSSSCSISGRLVGGRRHPLPVQRRRACAHARRKTPSFPLPNPRVRDPARLLSLGACAIECAGGYHTSTQLQ